VGDPDRARALASSACTVEHSMPHRSSFFVALAIATVLVAAVPGAPASAKPINACPVLAPEELEGIFEQPFRTGVRIQGDYCQFSRPAAADVPNVLVRVLANRYKSAKVARREFDQAERTMRELAVSVQNVPGVGDEAVSASFVGVDQLVVRTGKVVGIIRIDEPDADTSFPEQLVAVAQAAAPRLRNLSEAD